jgi:CRP-like cAMP-binding protein
MTSSALVEETRRSPMLTHLLMRYANAVMSMLAQTAACNRAHSLEERMCRWVLMTHDRVQSDDFPLTQEFLGQMLGVRRPVVSLVGRALQNAGLIRYGRGRVAVLDREGLEEASCECYAIVQREFEEAVEEARPVRFSRR